MYGREVCFKILNKSFYNREPEIVASALLGKYLIKVVRNNQLIGKIVETEAYLAFNDPASHSFKGKTNRNTSQFGPPGRAYVHQSRQHTLLDVVTQEVDIPGSVLIRAVEPIRGINIMIKNRGLENIYKIAKGPANLCKAFNITILDDGIDLTKKSSLMFILGKNEGKENFQIAKTTRIGISKATGLPLRFFIKDNQFVSS